MNETQIIGRRGGLIIVGMLLLLGLSFYFFPTNDSPAVTVRESEQAVLSGTVAYRERIALAPGSTVVVQLQNVSDDQSTPVVIAEQTIATEGKNVPIPFSLNYDPATIDSDRNYRVFVTIYDGESERFVSTQDYAVITKENPSTDVTIMLTMISNGQSPDSLPQEAATVPSLSGTSWVWQYTEGDSTASSSRVDAPAGEKFVLSFDTDSFTSTTDCNQLSGGYVQNNETLSFGPIASTKKACLEETLETTYVDTLTRVTTHAITGSQLRFTLLGDTGTMVFTQKPGEISIEEEAVFCTQDVMTCPDGSFVGRVAPGCAFAPCGEALVE